MAFEVVKKLFRTVRNLITGEQMKVNPEVAEIENLSTDRMQEAITEWLNMYLGSAPWIDEEGQSLGIPTVMAAEIARSVTLEMEMNINGDSPMAEFIAAQMKPFLSSIRSKVEYACATGGVIFKPYICDDGITIETVLPNNFYPTSFDGNGRITGGFFRFLYYKGKKVYKRFEKHEMLGGGKYRITNKCFVSSDETSLGDLCELTEVPEWSAISPVVDLNYIREPLFSYFRMPLGNTIDTGSPLGVSVFARAVNAIKEADKQYQRLIWEYKATEAAIDASDDAFDVDINGKPILPEGKERLYRINSLDSAKTGGSDLFKPWTPAIRDENYIRGMNRMLMQIEDLCCVARGTISDLNQDVKTATEIITTKQRTYSTISDIQSSLEDSLDRLVIAIEELAILYHLCPAGEYECAYVWDDSVIVDANTERMRDLQEVTQGLLGEYEYRMTWRGEDEETARKKIDEIKAGRSDNQILFGDDDDDDDNKEGNEGDDDE